MTDAPIEQNVPTLSQEKIALNLDTVERDAKRDPFTFVVGGRAITLDDPADLDWQDLAAFESDFDYLKKAMTSADLEHFLAQKLPVWKMEQLSTTYMKHFGAEEPGKAA